MFHIKTKKTASGFLIVIGHFIAVIKSSLEIFQSQFTKLI